MSFKPAKDLLDRSSLGSLTPTISHRSQVSRISPLQVFFVDVLVWHVFWRILGCCSAENCIIKLDASPRPPGSLRRRRHLSHKHAANPAMLHMSVLIARCVGHDAGLRARCHRHPRPRSTMSEVPDRSEGWAGRPNAMLLGCKVGALANPSPEIISWSLGN